MAIDTKPYPRRRHGRREPLPTDGSASSLVTKLIEERRAKIERGIHHAGVEAQPLHRGALDPKTPEEGAAIAAILAFEIDRQRIGGVARALVDHWLATRGAAFAVEACIASGLLGVRRDPHDGSLVLVRFRAMQAINPSYEDVPPAWVALRERLATMPDADYEAARTAARRAIDDAPLRLLVRIAFAFPDEKEWVDRAATAVIEGRVHSMLVMIMHSLGDRALIERVIDLAAQGEWELLYAAFDLADALGTEAAPLLMRLTDAALGRVWMMADDLTEIGLTALATLPTADVAAWFVDRSMNNPLVLAHATAFCNAAPKLALVELTRAVTAKRLGPPITSLLKRLVRRFTEEAKAILSELDETERAVLDRLIEREAIRAEAPRDRIPSILVSPPWHAKKKVKKKKSGRAASFEPLPHEETISWDDTPLPYIANEANTRPQEEEELRSANALVRPLWRLDGVPKEAALRLFREFTADQWFLYASDELARQVARFGRPAIDPVLAFSKSNPTATAKALEAVDSPRAASIMAHVFVRVRRERRVAERWLVRHPRAAAIGLIANLADPNAGKALRFLAARGHRAVIDEVANAYGGEAPSLVEAALDADADAPSKPPKMPEWFDPRALPRARLARSNEALPLEAIQHLGELLALVDPEEPFGGLETVREACDATSLGDFAWELFEAWMIEGYPASDKWAFFALGHFGRDEHAYAIAKLVRGWPTEGAFARAVLGLDVLATMKTDVSLMLLHGISEKVKSKPLLKKAKEKMESVAETLGLSAEELADRLVPTLGLDDDGSRVLAFGGEGQRSFRVGFDEFLRPFVQVIEDGKPRARLADLPKPGAKDDPTLAAEANAEWKALKKAAKLAATAQIARFEVAMIGGRRWDAASFATYLVKHPLVQHLVRRLVWSVEDEKGRIAGSFRVAEDGKYASVDDDAFEIPEGGRVGVLHRLEVDEATVKSWDERLTDYEIVQPFSQLGRNVPRGATTEDLSPLLEVETLKLLGLERRGWTRASAGYGGLVSELEKEAGIFRATLSLEPGIYAGDPSMNDTQTPREIKFATTRGPAVPSPVFLAEVVADLRAVGALA